MKLNYKNLFELYSYVSVRKPGPSVIKAQSLHDSTQWCWFSSCRLAERSKDIASMLRQLPKEMMQSYGLKGIPWFMACTNADGTRWGDMCDVDKLLAIGRAASLVSTYTPLVHCDVPYCVILDVEMKSHNL